MPVAVRCLPRVRMWASMSCCPPVPRACMSPVAPFAPKACQLPVAVRCLTRIRMWACMSCCPPVPRACMSLVAPRVRAYQDSRAVPTWVSMCPAASRAMHVAPAPHICTSSVAMRCLLCVDAVSPRTCMFRASGPLALASPLGKADANRVLECFPSRCAACFARTVYLHVFRCDAMFAFVFLRLHLPPVPSPFPGLRGGSGCSSALRLAAGASPLRWPPQSPLLGASPGAWGGVPSVNRNRRTGLWLV